MKKLITFLKRETVLAAAILLAVVSSVLVRPDKEYLGYIDYKTIGLLFSLMTVMAGFNRLGIFQRAGQWLLGRVSSPAAIAGVLVYLCFFLSMAITNDVALITFVPFAVTVLSMARMERLIVPVVVLQTIAANLGSMMTPVGNPQNLYLYSRAGIPFSEFLVLMAPYTAVSFALLFVCLVFVGRYWRKSGETTAAVEFKMQGDGGMTASGKLDFLIYLALFFVAMASVARVVPWQALCIAVLAAVFWRDKSLFFAVDYSLLLTFAAFFIFIGNMGRIPEFCAVLADVLEGREVITSVAASQVISNVPAALLLSGFSDQWEKLIIGTNLGGLGTLIASMASLISYKAIAVRFPEKKKSYFSLFTALNLVFLAVLLVMAL